MLDHLESMFRSDPFLSLLDGFVVEFLHAAAGGTNQVVVVHAVVQFIDGPA